MSVAASTLCTGRKSFAHARGSATAARGCWRSASTLSLWPRSANSSAPNVALLAISSITVCRSELVGHHFALPQTGCDALGHQAAPIKSNRLAPAWPPPRPRPSAARSLDDDEQVRRSWAPGSRITACCGKWRCPPAAHLAPLVRPGSRTVTTKTECVGHVRSGLHRNVGPGCPHSTTARLRGLATARFQAMAWPTTRTTPHRSTAPI